jgi:hypothetical protein
MAMQNMTARYGSAAWPGAWIAALSLRSGSPNVSCPLPP